jgi:hypothetical protein
MPTRAMKDAFRLTTTSTAIPIKISGRTSNTLLNTENSEASAT